MRRRSRLVEETGPLLILRVQSNKGYHHHHPLLAPAPDMPWSLLRRFVRIVRNCAVPVSATVAVAPRYGPELAIVLRFILTVVRELEVRRSAVTRQTCRRFRRWFAHYPCSELRKPCITPTKLPNKRLTYTALWAPHRGGPLCNVAGARRVAAAGEEIWLPDAND